MRTTTRRNRVLTIILAGMLVFSLATPAMATFTPENKTDANTQDAVHSSLTVPLTFDGSKPDSSEVTVQNALIANSMASTALPEKVTTAMTDGSTRNLNLLTADKYFYAKQYAGDTDHARYVIEFQDFFANSAHSDGTYYARISPNNSTPPTNCYFGNIEKYGNDGYVDFSDISNVLSNGAANLYISVVDSESSSANVLYYTASPVATTFVQDDAAVAYYGNYIYSGNLQSYIDLRLPSSLGGASTYEIALLDSGGAVVAKSIQDLSHGESYTANMKDDRYDSVFGENRIYSYGCSVSTQLFFAKQLAAGKYDVQVTAGMGTPVVYQDLVKVVNTPVVTSFYTASDNGLAPATYGGNTAYASVCAEGASLSDFTVLILDSKGNTLETNQSSRYYYGSMYYKVTLKKGTFVSTEQYSMKLTYNGTGNIYYSPTEQTLNIEDYFRVYGLSFNGAQDKADFTLKAISPPSGEITLGLFSANSGAVDQPATPLATATVTAGETMHVTFTDGSSADPLMLASGSYYIAMQQSYGTSEYFWHSLNYFYVSSSSGSNYSYSKPLTYTKTDSTYAFDVSLGMTFYGLSTDSTYSASLVSSDGTTPVGTLSGSLKVTSADGDVGLSGTFQLNSGAHTEGLYCLKITAVTGAASTDIKIPVGCLDPAKTYGLSYPSLSSKGIDGSFWGPAMANFDASKFSYVLKDLNGTKLTIPAPTIKQNDTWDGYISYDINVTFAAPLLPGYYSLELQYDGQSFYSLDNPKQLMFSGYNLYDFVAATPEVNSWYMNSSRETYGVLIDPGQVANPTITALVYENSVGISDFTPVKILTLAKNPLSGVYEFTDLTGITSGKEYDVAILANDMYIDYWEGRSLGSSTASTAAVESVSIDKDSIDLAVGHTSTLHAGISPVNATNQNVTWSSGNPSVATVSSSGVVTAIATGTATITVTTADGGKTDTCQVNVYDTIAVTGVTLNASTLTLNAANTKTLTATVAPSNASNKTVTWSSGNTAVATVDASTGQITAVAAGSAVITATTADGGKTATCTVTVGVTVSGSLTFGIYAPSNIWIDLFKADGTALKSVRADAKGGFSFTEISAGDYVIKANSPDSGYKPFRYSVTVAQGDTAKSIGTQAYESIYPNASTVTVDISGIANSSTCNIGIYNYETRYYSYKSASNATPSVTFDNVPYSTAAATSYTVYIYDSASGYYEEKSVTVASSSTSLDFTIPVRYSISGKVAESDGTAVKDATVVATETGHQNATYYGYTDNDGNYTITALPAGTYNVSVSPWGGYTSNSQAVTVAPSSATGCNLTATAGMTLQGKVQKSDGTTPYKAYVYLQDNSGQYVAGGYSTGEGGFSFSKAVKAAGSYTLHVSYMYNADYSSVRFVSTPVTVTVADTDFTTGFMTVNIPYSDPVNSASIFTGSDNVVVSDLNVVHDGSTVNLVVRYKNNSTAAVDSATFTATLPTGVTVAAAGSDTFTVSNLAAGASGEKIIALKIGAEATNNVTIPVTVKIGSETYDFGSASMEYANITLNSPGAVKSDTSFKVYGEATANSAIVIKNAETGEVLGAARTSGRWYSSDVKFATAGTYKIVAEATNSGVTASSKILTVDVRADQITVGSVTENGINPPFNKKIGAYTFSTYAHSNLSGFDIAFGATFNKDNSIINDDSITSVTYHFSDKDYAATKNSSGVWAANLTGWSGAGLKTITATVITSDGRTLEFILCEVTVLIDPSGIINDAETGKPIAGATVYCYVYKNGAWELWDAESYGQVNPLTTDANGYYGWMVPDGTYSVRAYKDGYVSYDSTADTKFSNSGTSTIVIPPARSDIDFSMTPTIAVTGLSLNKATSAIEKGSIDTLTATVTPTGATNAANITWTSDNTSVATVSNGTVTAVSVGTATITASIGTIKADCTVTVSNGSTPGAVSPAASDANPTIKADSAGKATITSKNLSTADTLSVDAAADIAFDKAATTTLKATAADIAVTVAKVNSSTLSEDAKALVGDRPVYEISVTAGGKAISEFGGGTLTISIPYTLKAGEDPNAVVVYYIDSTGKLQTMLGAYDTATGKVVFLTNHLSKYAVGYNKVTFSDVASNAWYNSAVTFAAARGITTGTGNNCFSPDANLTRGQFLVLLLRALGVSPNANTSSNFADAGDTYYTAYLATAKQLGIATGTGNNMFAPETQITRQDMSVLLYRTLKALDKLPAGTTSVTVSSFKDSASVSSYAVEALNSLVANGLISGSNNALDPLGVTTRAQMAQVLYNLLTKLT